MIYKWLKLASDNKKLIIWLLAAFGIGGGAGYGSHFYIVPEKPEIPQVQNEVAEKPKKPEVQCICEFTQKRHNELHNN